MGRRPKNAPAEDITRAMPRVKGARVSRPLYSRANGLLEFLPRQYQWEHGYDLRNYRSYSSDTLLEMLAAVHPDISMAVHNLVTISNTPVHIKARPPKASSKEEEGVAEDEEAQRAIDEILQNMDNPPTTYTFQEDTSLERLKRQAFWCHVLRGACAAELVPTSELDDVQKMVIVDPVTIRFFLDDDRLVPYQYQPDVPPEKREASQWKGDYRKIDYPTIFYVALNDNPNDPHGLPWFLPALQVVFFQWQVLQDLAAVVHKQGYPRLDITVVEEVLIKNAPAAVRSNPEKLKEWLLDRLEDISDYVSSVDPDDAFVHYDSIKFGVAGQANGPLIDVQKLIQVWDTQINAALKQISVALGRHFGKNETYSYMELKLYTETIKCLQRAVAVMLKKLFTLALRLRGIQAIVDVEFEEPNWLNEVDRQSALTQKIKNAARMRDQGWISDEEASVMVTGHRPHGTPRVATMEEGEDEFDTKKEQDRRSEEEQDEEVVEGDE